MEEFGSLGCLQNKFKPSGSVITPVRDRSKLEEVRGFSKGKSKDDSPVLTTYCGNRQTFSPSDIFFIDIDTQEGVDTVLSDTSKLFNSLPCLLFVQKSHSGKLHICGRFPRVCQTEDEWKINARNYTLTTIWCIKKLYDIDYSQIKDGVDLHSFNWWQLLLVSSHKIIYNDSYTPITLKRGDVAKLLEIYSSLLPEQNKCISVTERTENELAGKYKDGELGRQRLCVDRNLKIGKYTGNEIRWRISNIAVSIFEDKAKEWCDKYFYYSKGSIFSPSRKRDTNHLVLSWLINHNYIKESEEKRVENKQTEKNQDEIIMSSQEFLSSYVDRIDDYIKNENVLAISAPTGAGKTTMLSGYVSGKKSCKGLVDIYKRSIILVPFNVTNNLYAPLNIISSSTSNKYESGKPNVMIWDQFNRYFEEIRRALPDVVFIDESHTLYLDQAYRDSAIKCMDNLKILQESGVKLVFISATPAREVDRFNAFLLKFKKKDERDIKYEIRYVKDAFSNMMEDIRRGEFDRICIFSDFDCRLGYANAIEGGYKSIIYHSEWKENVDRLRQSEILDSNIVFLTCIAFNGLNIRNRGERILIDIRCKPCETTSNEIKQIVGRFRFNEDITVRLYVDMKFSSNIDIDQQFKDAKIICESDSEELVDDYWRRLADERVNEEIKSIDEYRKRFTIPVLVLSLKEDFPVRFFEEKVNDCAESVQRRNPLKKRASDKFKQWRISGEEQIDSNIEIQKFINLWKRRTWNLVGKYGDRVWEVIDKKIGVEKGKTTPKLVCSIIDEVEHIIDISRYDDSQWKEIVSKRSCLLDSDGLSDRVKKSIRAIFKKVDAIRESYGQKEFDYVIDMLCDESDSVLNAFLGGQSDGGKKSKKNRVRRVRYKGREYESIRELADAISKPESTIYNWIKKDKVQYVKS